MVRNGQSDHENITETESMISRARDTLRGVETRRHLWSQTGQEPLQRFTLDRQTS